MVNASMLRMVFSKSTLVFNEGILWIVLDNKTVVSDASMMWLWVVLDQKTIAANTGGYLANRHSCWMKVCCESYSPKATGV